MTLPPPPPAPVSPAPVLPPKSPAVGPTVTALVQRPTACAPVNPRPTHTLSDGSKIPVDHGSIRSSAGRGAAMLTSYLAVEGALVVLVIHQTRVYRWVSARHVQSRATVALGEQFDARTHQLFLVLVALLAVAMAATALWSRRVASNAQALGRQDVSVGASTWGWFVPFVWYFAGFRQLRKLDRIAGAVIGWQMAFVTPFVAGYVGSRITSVRTSFDVSMEGSVSTDTLLSGLRSIWIVQLMFVGCLGLAILAASRAVIRAHRLFSEAAALEAHTA